MADGGSLAFEKKLEDIVRAEFKDRGLDLKSFSAQLEFSDRVGKRLIIETRLTLIFPLLIRKSKSRKSKTNWKD